MQLLTLDAQFRPFRYLEYTNLQWNRRYYECGDFSIRIPAYQYSSEMKYVYCSSRPETGIIQKIEYEQTVKGEFIQLSGFFLERILWDKIMYPTFYASGNTADAAREAVSKYKDDIPLLVVKPSTAQFGASDVWQETGGQLGEVLYSRLQSQGLSQRCVYDLDNNVINYEVWQGLDRTESQMENNFVTFSTGMKNIREAKVTSDDSNYKNYFIVAGSGENEERIVVDVDLSNGGYKKELFVDARSETYNPDEQTLDDYKSGLYAKGVETSLDYLSTFNVEATARNVGFVYRKDYDIGDICDIMISGLNLSLTARIIEVQEVVKNNQHSITLSFGDKIVTSAKKARLQ